MRGEMLSMTSVPYNLPRITTKRSPHLLFGTNGKAIHKKLYTSRRISVKSCPRPHAFTRTKQSASFERPGCDKTAAVTVARDLHCAQNGGRPGAATAPIEPIVPGLPNRTISLAIRVGGTSRWSDRRFGGVPAFGLGVCMCRKRRAQYGARVTSALAPARDMEIFDDRVDDRKSPSCSDIGSGSQENLSKPALSYVEYGQVAAPLQRNVHRPALVSIDVAQQFGGTILQLKTSAAEEAANASCPCASGKK